MFLLYFLVVRRYRIPLSEGVTLQAKPFSYVAIIEGTEIIMDNNHILFETLSE